MIQLPYKPKYDREFLLDYLSKNFYKKNYDRFLWWRGYSLKKRPLSDKHPLRDRILNGDFDFGPYLYEAQLTEHNLNDLYESVNGDLSAISDKWPLQKARRKRLLEDYEKDEKTKLEDLKKAFLFEFKITKQEYDEHVIDHKGEELIDFYYHVADRFRRYARKSKPVPKFR